MNKILFLIVSLHYSLMLCGQDLSALNTTIDLSEFCDSVGEYDSNKCLPFSMRVPKGTQLVIGDWSSEITLDETFSIEVTEGDYLRKGDGTKIPSVRDGFGPHLPYNKEFLINKRKAGFEENDINVLAEYVLEDENGFIAKTKVFQQFEYHFFFATSNGKVSFTFENEKGRSYNQAEARLMYESLKTIRWN